MSERMRQLLTVLCLATLAGCSQGRAKFDQAPLITREVLFGNPDKARPQISPDGTRLAYLAPVDGVLNVWVGPIDDPGAAEPVTHDTHRGVQIYFFAYTNEHVLYIQDKDGDENWRVYCVDLNTKAVKDLSPLEGVAARIQEVSPEFPDEILIGLNDRVPQLHDVYLVNIRTGERTRVMENEGFAGYVTDEQLRVRLAVRVTPDGGSEYLRRAGDDWEPFMIVSREDDMTTGVQGFDKSAGSLYMLDSRGRDTSALTLVDLDTGAIEVLAENAKADINRVLRHPTEKTLQAAGFNFVKQDWEFFDLRVAGDFDILRSLGGGEVNIVSRTRDDRHWIVAMTMDDGPVRYYYYDRQTREPDFLFTNRQALEDQPLAKMHPVVIKSGDGLDLVSYLTLPVGSNPDDGIKPSSPVPMVLLVHGGPWWRDTWGYNPYHQWLANRGYAVLSVNYRASTGFGKAFINAGDLQHAGKMHDDLIDAVNWAVEEKTADPDKIAIMGTSYGGYATLVGLTFTPEVFACGVDVCGPSSMLTLLESVPEYWTPILDILTSRLGDHRTEEGREYLKKVSPLTRVDSICRPLLIGQGANDPRVKQAEADQIVAAMETKDIPVTYLLYPDEGHGLLRPENIKSFNAVAEAFLAEHLGGRVEPIGNDFAGSSVTVPTGAKGVAGLCEALTKLEGATPAGG